MPTARTDLAPIGRFYLIECSHSEGSYCSETSMLPHGKDWTFREGLAELQQQDGARAVLEVIPNEGYVRDVSEDMARAWLDEFDGERDALPGFIGLHLTDDEVDAHFAEIDADARYARELASPGLTGRI